MDEKRKTLWTAFNLSWPTACGPPRKSWPISPTWRRSSGRPRRSWGPSARRRPRRRRWPLPGRSSAPPRLSPGSIRRAIFCCPSRTRPTGHPAGDLRPSVRPLLRRTPDALQESSVAVVGARRPTPYGRAAAEKLARDLAASGLVVVSGLARGIDSIAHWGALDSGRTVAVLGFRAGRYLPPENKGLLPEGRGRWSGRHGVRARYAAPAVSLPSSEPDHQRPLPGHGGRGSHPPEWFAHHGAAVPGAESGCYGRPRKPRLRPQPGDELADQVGAKLVETWEDVVEELPSPLRERCLSRRTTEKKTMPALSPDEQKLFDRLSVETPVHIDDLVEAPTPPSPNCSASCSTWSSRVWSARRRGSSS